MYWFSRSLTVFQPATTMIVVMNAVSGTNQNEMPSMPSR